MYYWSGYWQYGFFWLDLIQDSGSLRERIRLPDKLLVKENLQLHQHDVYQLAIDVVKNELHPLVSNPKKCKAKET